MVCASALSVCFANGLHSVKDLSVSSCSICVNLQQVVIQDCNSKLPATVTVCVCVYVCVCSAYLKKNFFIILYSEPVWPSGKALGW